MWDFLEKFPAVLGVKFGMPMCCSEVCCDLAMSC